MFRLFVQHITCIICTVNISPGNYQKPSIFCLEYLSTGLRHTPHLDCEPQYKNSPHTSGRSTPVHYTPTPVCPLYSQKAGTQPPKYILLKGTFTLSRSTEIGPTGDKQKARERPRKIIVFPLKKKNLANVFSPMFLVFNTSLWSVLYRTDTREAEAEKRV